MKIVAGQMFQLIEFDGGFLITHPNDKLENRPATPLVLADETDLCEYFQHYIAARKRGVPGKEAHDIALQAANIPKVVKLS